MGRSAILRLFRYELITNNYWAILGARLDSFDVHMPNGLPG